MNDKASKYKAFILIPALAPILFFAIALSPVELLGCLLRGAAALAVSLASCIIAVVLAAKAAMSRATAGPDKGWHLLRGVILAIPVVAMLVLA